MSGASADHEKFTTDQTAVLEKINVVLSVFSFLGSVFILFCFWKLKDVRSFVFQLVFWVALSDTFYSVGNFLGDAGGNQDTHVGASNALCTVQAVLISFFGLASMLWSASIAFTLHMAFLRGDIRFRSPSIEPKWKFYHGLCWGYPLVMTLLPFTTMSYGDTGGWCWLTNHEPVDKAWRYLQFYLLLWVVIIYNLYVYVKVYYKMKNIAESGGANMSEQAARVRLYPLVLVVCWFWGTINTLYKTFTSGDGLLWLNGLAIFFAASMPLVNATVYGFTPIIRRELLHLIGCSKDTQGEEESVAGGSVRGEQVGMQSSTAQGEHTPQQDDRLGMENEMYDSDEVGDPSQQTPLDDEPMFEEPATMDLPRGSSTVFHKPSHIAQRAVAEGL
eukprot:gb/GEZN01007134.1/.p1 GENE.gb/GEZN01007134.1/~~gb/GEZN01007134.1/.p1  ORF type:complete len:388 (+),score=69.85 gb/GEZN01007134.1/:128-1291(+)